jgi:hypothetical protein
VNWRMRPGRLDAGSEKAYGLTDTMNGEPRMCTPCEAPLKGHAAARPDRYQRGRVAEKAGKVGACPSAASRSQTMLSSMV